MYKWIKPNNNIFQNSVFLKDKYLFNTIFYALDSPNLVLYSDEENYLLCRGDTTWPTYIWTKDKLEKKYVKEIEELIEKYYLTDNCKFTCKKELYDYLIEDKFPYINLKETYEMNCLKCSKLIKPKDKEVERLGLTKEDIKTIAEYWYQDTLETKDPEVITKKQALEDAEFWYRDKNFNIIKDHNNKIVSMAYYTINNDVSIISHVYTPKEERRKGYASKLIFSITKELLEKEIIPLLYTKRKYLPANKAYQKIGYKEEGYLVNFKYKKELENENKNR